MTSWNTFGHLLAENGQSVVLKSPVALFMCVQGQQWQQTAWLCIRLCVGGIQGQKAAWLHKSHNMHNLHNLHNLHKFCQVGWTEPTGPSSVKSCARIGALILTNTCNYVRSVFACIMVCIWYVFLVCIEVCIKNTMYVSWHVLRMN